MTLVTGDYSWVSRIGGAVWLFLLAMIILMPTVTPLVRARFGDGVPVPRFRRSLIQSVDTKVLADTLAVAVRELGMKVPRRWVHRALGIPEAAEDEAVLSGGSQS